MRLGCLEVSLVNEPLCCDQCGGDKQATLVMDGQPLCSEHAGQVIATSPDALGDMLGMMLAAHRDPVGSV